MRPKCTAILIALLAIVPFTAHSSPKQVTKIFLTRIDVSTAAGLTLNLEGKSLVLCDLAGERAKSFSVAPATVMVRPNVSEKSVVVNRRRRYVAASQTWKITDQVGEGVEIIDSSVHTLIIVSQVDHPLTFISGRNTARVPGHAIVMINNPAKDAVLDYGGSGWLGFTGDYKEKMWPVDQPTEVIVSPNDSGITGGFPTIIEDTHCDQPIALSSN